MGRKLDQTVVDMTRAAPIAEGANNPPMDATRTPAKGAREPTQPPDVAG